MTVHRLFPLHHRLIAKCSIEHQEPTEKVTPRKGVHCRAAHAHAVKHPKWVVLEVRRLKETHGLGHLRIVDELGLRGVEISQRDIDRYVTYQSRAELVPEVNRREPYSPADTGEA